MAGFIDRLSTTESPAARRNRVLLVTAILLCTVGLTIAVIGGTAALSLDPGLTGARRVTWYGPKGETLPFARGKQCGDDIRLTAVVHAGKVWTVCTAGQPEYPGGALARLDPAAGEGRVFWPAPKQAPILYSRGLAGGPDGLLGFVYFTPRRETVAAIAGPRGWETAPVQLPDSGMILGLAFEGRSLEIVIRPFDHGWQTITILTLHPGKPGIAGRRLVEPARLCHDAAPNCTVAGAYRGKSDNLWHFVGDEFVRGKHQSFDAAETGTRRVGEHRYTLSSGRTDLTLTGRLHELTTLHRERLGPAGVYEVLPKRPVAVAQEEARRSAHYTVVGGRLLRRRHWWHAGRGAYLSQHRGQQVWLWETKHGDIRLALAPSKPNAPGRRVASGVGCFDLASGVLVPIAAGGYWLVSPHGCYVKLGARWHRSDPLTVVEHLDRRGSMVAEPVAPRYAGYLAWVLFGLPICLLLAVGGGLLHARHTSRDRWPTILLWVLGGAVTFAVSGGILLGDVLPLLR